MRVPDPQIRAVLQIASQQVVVQNVHVPPPVTLDRFQRQCRIATRLAEWAAAQSRPVIIAGDFNATEESLPMRLFGAARLTNAFSAQGFGRGTTWIDIGPLRLLPGFRIDHILCGGGVRPVAAQVGPSINSDHRPLFARLALPSDRSRDF